MLGRKTLLLQSQRHVQQVRRHSARVGGNSLRRVIVPFDTISPSSFPSNISRWKDGDPLGPPPCRFPTAFFIAKLPAFSRWFQDTKTDTTTTTTTATQGAAGSELDKDNDVLLRQQLQRKYLNVEYLMSFGKDPALEVEIALPPQTPGAPALFERAELLLSQLACHINQQCDPNYGQSAAAAARVYCAQVPPPAFLEADLPPPFEHLGLEVRTSQQQQRRHNNQGGSQQHQQQPKEDELQHQVDIYSNAIWLGTAEASRTPLHKDPNHNVFVQLSGKKRIRVFSPLHGANLLENCGAPEIVMQRLRTDDMMIGGKARDIDEAVWGDGECRGKPVTGYEAAVGPGDAVFVPKGWWHAVRGVEDDPDTRGAAVASVNWWFRTMTAGIS